MNKANEKSKTSQSALLIVHLPDFRIVQLAVYLYRLRQYNGKVPKFKNF